MAPITTITSPRGDSPVSDIATSASGLRPGRAPGPDSGLGPGPASVSAPTSTPVGTTPSQSRSGSPHKQTPPGYLRFPFGSVTALFRRLKTAPPSSQYQQQQHQWEQTQSALRDSSRPDPPPPLPKSQAQSQSQLPPDPFDDPLSFLLLPDPLSCSSPSGTESVRIWEPEEYENDKRSNNSRISTTNNTADLPDFDLAYLDSIWTSIPTVMAPARATDTFSLSASTASSIPALSHDSRSDYDVALVPPAPTPAPAPALRKPKQRTVVQRAATPKKVKKGSFIPLSEPALLTDLLGTVIADPTGGVVTANIRLTARFRPESLPPALRDILPHELEMCLISESAGLSEHGPPTHRGEPVLDRFGFQMLDSASTYSLRTFQYRKLQNQKMDKWATFKRQCHTELPVSNPMNDEIQLGMANWGSAAETGRSLQSRFNSLVGHGIPVQLRAEVWKEAIATRLVISPGDYDSYLSRANTDLSPEVLRDIEFDVVRTLTQSNLFFYDSKAIGSDRLRSILQAYAVRNPDTGYCQGMNKIAAYVILTVPDPDTAFHIFTAMIDTVMPARYWTDSMNLASADQHVLKSLLSRELPEVYMHLQKLNSFVVPFTLRWFVSLFTDGLYNTSAEFVYRVWDMILTRPFPDGYNHLLAVSVAIFEENQDLILATKTTMDLHDVIAHRLGVTDHRLASVLAKADEMQVPVKVIDSLRERARLQLSSGDANAEGDMPGCVSSRVLNHRPSSRLLRLPALPGLGRLRRNE